MLLRDYLQSIEQVYFKADSPEYLINSALVVAEKSSNNNPVSTLKPEAVSGKLYVSAQDQFNHVELIPEFPKDQAERYIWLMLKPGGSAWIICSHSYYLFGFCNNLVENWLDRDIDEYETGKFIVPSFKWNRTAYDYFLTQEGRICSG